MPGDSFKWHNSAKGINGGTSDHGFSLDIGKTERDIVLLTTKHIPTII